ncbi:MAG: IS30 family transposase [Bacteroidales bacterium]
MYKQLTMEQRYAISVLLQRKCGKKEISEAIGVHISSIYRELNRNKSKHKYSYLIAQEMSIERKERLCVSRKFTAALQRDVEKKINDDWSPEQICGRLKAEGKPSVSHETIYKHIRTDKRNGGALWMHCRHKLKHRKRQVGDKRIPIRNRIGIEQRPPEANGKRFGDWEMDTIIGKDGREAIVTLVERSKNYMLMSKLKYGKNAKALAQKVISMLLPYKNNVLTITTDNGTEFAEHQLIAQKLNTKVFFAHPYSSWEKGAIEHTNKLIRQYIPKKSVFKTFSDAQILEIQHKINRRPRKKLNFKSPVQCFFNLLL